METAMKLSLFASSLLAFLAVRSAAADDAVKAELEKLQGAWQLISAEIDGKAAPEENLKKVRVVIKGNKHSVYFGDDTVAKEIPFTIDPTRKPKETTDTLPDGRQIKGIY